MSDLSRNKTAELLKRLRAAAKESRMLKVQAERAQQSEPEAALRLFRQQRRRGGKPR
jgi:hypothetical protein